MHRGGTSAVADVSAGEESQIQVVFTNTLYSAVYAATAHIHVSYKCIRMSHTYAFSRDNGGAAFPSMPLLDPAAVHRSQFEIVREWIAEKGEVATAKFFSGNARAAYKWGAPQDC